MGQRHHTTYVGRMRERFASYLLTLCLVLSMTAGSVIAGMAQGRAQLASAPRLDLVICDTDGGTSVITVDRFGNPVDPEDHCDDRLCDHCLSTVTFDLPPVTAGLTAEPTAVHARVVARHFQLPSYTAFFAAARGPPVKV